MQGRATVGVTLCIGCELRLGRRTSAYKDQDDSHYERVAVSFHLSAPLSKMALWHTRPRARNSIPRIVPMATGSLLALLDDIASILDDVSVMTKVAAKKTAGCLAMTLP